jgi:Ca2+-binding RTX toxin-like protein
MSQYPSTIDLSSLDGTTGFRLAGVGYDFSGVSVASAGDVNGDGFADLIVGAPQSGSTAGASYVVFGKASGFAASFNLAALDGSTGFRLAGVAFDDLAGFSVASAGDVNGDGFADLIVGARAADANGANSGASYVVFGKSSGFAANINLSSLDGSTGFKLSGAAAGDVSGNSVSSAGDVNGDGFADLIVGAPFADTSAADAGAGYVVFGKASGFAANINLSALNGTTGFRLSGMAAVDLAGFSVASAGDVNGDGFADLIVGARAADANGSNSGASYVVFGKASGFAASIDLSGLNGTTGFRLSGAAAGDVSGTSVASAGDVNGDGFADLIIGAPGASPNGSASGASYVVFGNASGFAASIDLSSLNGSTGFKLSGAAADDHSGFSVGSAGDVNGDGFADLIVGAYGADPNGANSGASYVVFGKASGFASNIDLSGLDGSTGFKLSGVTAGDTSGQSVASAGDVNGDGLADLIVGAPTADTLPYGTNSGASYVVFGRLPDTAVNRTGSAASQTLTGGNLADVLSGLGGNDTLYGHGGNDTIDGGAGTDFAVYFGTRLNYQIVQTTGPAGSFFTITDLRGGSPDGTDTLTNVETLKFSDATLQLSASSIGLSTLNGTNGFSLSGATAFDFTGVSVASAGDINRDGFDDVIVGADGVDDHGFSSGASYVVFGKASGFAANLDLSTLDGSTGFKLSGAAASDHSGLSVASAGDVNGDGFADLIVGAFNVDTNAQDAGASYVVFGKASGFTANINLSSLDGGNGFRLDGVAIFDRSGGSVASAGDVNGDGFADVIIGAQGVDTNGYNSGASYVVFGKASGFAASLNLSTLDGSTGFRLAGAAAEDRSGASVGSAGDVNGDGFADLIVGAPWADPNGEKSGTTYVVFGKASGFAPSFNLSTLDGSTGFRISGAATNDQSFGLVSAGDINGDGFDDVIVGAAGADPNGSGSGASYVVFGKAAGFSANIELSSLDGSTGFRLSGAAPGDDAGVAAPGDVNGDGFDDLIIGAPRVDPNGTKPGVSYVMFGKASGFAANIELSSLHDSTGFKLSGISARDYSGGSVSAGDVNGDGLADLIVGAWGADPNGSASGASYVIFGQLPDIVFNRTGSAASQTLTGADLADTLSGLGGNDTLYGHGGNDTIDGGSGADTMIGGDGNDTFFVDNQSDVVTENSNEGSDTVLTALDFYTLPTNVEALVLQGGADLHGYGNALANTLIGNSGNNLLDGYIGADVMSGGAGNDVYFTDNIGDAVLENANEGDDSIFTTVDFYTLSANVENLILEGGADLHGYGNGGANVLYGNSGNNLLDGAGGADLMVGGAGNDTYFVDNPGDSAFEAANEGNDSVFASCNYGIADGVENLILQGTGNFQAYGNSQANVIYGNAGNNLINAAGGADLMVGGAGNDTYFVDDPSDSCFEVAGQGNDAVFASCNYGLAADVETLVMQGSGDFQGYGNNSANTLYGNSGNNLLNGGGGADTMAGGAGNDTYFADNAGDNVVEATNQGADVVFASVNYTLAANVETLVLQGGGNLSGTGNGQANNIFGNSGNNVLNGAGGSDVLTGHAGNDTFVFAAGEGNGDTVVDFAGNGAAAGDLLLFVGYGAGASFNNIDTTHWQVNYNSGASHEIIALMNGAAIDASDFAFV